MVASKLEFSLTDFRTRDRGDSGGKIKVENMRCKFKQKRRTGQTVFVYCALVH